MSTITDILTRVESSSAKLIVLYLHKVGTATVSQIADYLDMKKMSVYSVLEQLRDKEILARLEHSHADYWTFKEIQLH